MAFDQPISNQLVTFLTRFQYALLGGIFLSVAVIPIALAETDCQKAPLMPVEQCETLMALYHSTNGFGWINKEGWNTTDEPCEFALVDCEDGNVTNLNLQQNRLKGSLPDLSSLIHLETLSLRQNQLTGPIPELSSLTQLNNVSFYRNNLCGQIPDLNTLTNLERLDLSQNQLSGPIPALNELKKTSPYIALSGNQLCRDENNNYTGFESTVDRYSVCVEEEEYPPCLKYMQLKISKEGEGTGSVTGIGIDCGDDCDEQYDGNTEVTLTAAPAAGSIFKEWSGACSGTDVCQMTLDQSQEVIATFDLSPVSYALTVKLDGTGSGTVSAENIDCGSDCTEEYPENAEVILTATPETDSAFTGWNGACSGTDVCTVSMTEAQDITASFDLISTANELTVSKKGSGVGTIRGEGINCGSDCSEQYGNNTRITLNAIPGTGATFAGWAGACFGANPSCQIIMDQTKNVTATFNRKTEPTIKQYTLTVNKDGTGAGTIRGNGIDCGSDCSEQYAENTDVTLNAIAAADSAFAGWAGACSGTGASCIVSLTQAKTVTASFNLLAPSTQTDDLEFVFLKPSYNVGELVTVDLVEHLQFAPRSSRVDLWVAVAYPENTFHFMTDQPLEPFSLAAQPYRRNIVSSELATTEKRYHLLYFDVPPNVAGTYDFYAIYNEAGADLSNLLFTQQSNLAFTSTVLNNNMNPSILSSPPDTLTMLVGEALELIVDSEMTFNALLSTCTMNPLDIVQSESAQSSSGNGVSCHLTALKPGSATLTTTDRNSNTLETVIVVKSF
jgi:hypothetical protein